MALGDTYNWSPLDLTPGAHWSMGRQRHRFFDGLVSYLVAVASIGAALGAQSMRSQGSWAANETIVLNSTGRIADIGLVLHPKSLMDELARERWPQSLMFVVETADPQSRAAWSDEDGPNLEGLLLRAAFVQYVETIRPQLPPGSYPLWDFGRVVRNAFVHDGKIDIRKPRDEPVSWRGITYGPADNGRQVLGHDLAAVELVMLMREMDDVGQSSPRGAP